jgi:hypothetical protein
MPLMIPYLLRIAALTGLLGSVLTAQTQNTEQLAQRRAEYAKVAKNVVPTLVSASPAGACQRE